MEPSLTHEAFTKHVDTKFNVPVDDNRNVELELAEVSELTEWPGQEQFAVVFRGPNDVFLGQGTRSFEHDQMGRFELLIVPIRQDQQGYYYEAVFNRFRQ
ncbi:MAG TPA: hypothetical protein VK208_03130 [Pyrinomonadaceae bacterium]|jgi:hypothetical protein|nr:hypothetical protein [Pyrinomonadaceae bacterium]